MASKDRGALIAFARSTGWTDGRTPPTPIREWGGVGVVEGRVVKLFITHGLEGPIPAVLGLLSELTELRLNGSKLTGSIPNAMGSLSKLGKLVLGQNQLAGPIPEVLGALTQLTVLDLNGNKLTGSIPTWLRSLRKLQDLRLDSNQLEGPIPLALGALKDLRQLGLSDNKHTGSIPTCLGSLSKLRILRLYGNQLAGPIPKEIGALKKLEVLSLKDNKLTGHVPKELGAMENLLELYLQNNQLTGHVPEELGAMESLQELYLQNNQLTGALPTEFGSMSVLSIFELENTGSQATLLDGNKVTGGPAKGEKYFSWRERISRQQQTLEGNEIEEGAPVPPPPTPPKGPAVRKTWWKIMSGQQRTHQGDGKEGNSPAIPPVLPPPQQEPGEGDEKEEEVSVPLPGTPPVLPPSQQEPGEGDEKEEEVSVPLPGTPPVLPPPQQEPGEGDEKEEEFSAPLPGTPPVLSPPLQETGQGDEHHEDARMPRDSPTGTGEVVVERALSERALSANRSSLSHEEQEADRLFRGQILASAGLGSLTKGNPEALDKFQRVIEAPVAGTFFFGDELSDLEKRRRISALMTMAMDLGEVALSHTEDMEVQQKERALSPFSKAYYTAVRSGLCNAYLAASVMGSNWVSTSKTGVMGKAGAALQLISSALPLIGGWTGLAGKALQTGDHHLQTRRLVKIAAMAPDAVECCCLARSLALQLTDGLKQDTSAVADEADQVNLNTTTGMSGGSGSSQGASIVAGGMNEDDVFEYLLEEVASYEQNDDGAKRLGKQHLRKLLKAIQRGCLDGSNCTDHKIEVLLLEILPEPDIRTAETPSTLEEVFVRSPVATPAYDSGLPSTAEAESIRKELEALKFAFKSANDEHQAELNAIKSEKEKLQTELGAELAVLKSANEKLQRKVKNLEDLVPEPGMGPGENVDVGGGQVLRRRLAVTQTAEGFFDRARDTADNHRPVTVGDLREFGALHREMQSQNDDKFRELEGEIGKKANKRKGRRWPSFSRSRPEEGPKP
ncbi:unnamed protein product [Ectocarpus sp. 8 AP-2014]